MQLGELLGDRLASVPVLSTILRVDLKLWEDSRDRAIRIVQNWVDRKRPSLKTDWTKHSGIFRDSAGYECSYAEGEGAFALSFEHPDSQIPERSWVVDTSLERREADSYFATRLSIRQPKNCQFPAPRAPRILCELIQAVPVTDALALAATPQVYEAGDLGKFLQLLRSPYRALPLVAISTEEVSGQMLVEAETLASMLAGVAHVAVLSSEASWGLTHALGKAYSVYQGAVRCYAAGFSENDNVRQHRLWLAESILRISSDKHRFMDQCLTYCFAQVTSTFESFPLLTSRAIKARVAAVQPLAAVEIPSVQPERAEAVDTVAAEPLAAETGPFPQATERLYELEALVGKLESELQEVRSQNAELAKKFEEEQSFRVLFEDENQRLTERVAILNGASLDQSQPGALFLKALGDAAVAAQVLVDDYKQLRAITTTVDAVKAEVNQLRDDNFDLKSRIALFEQQRQAETEEVQQLVIQLRDPDTLQDFFVAKIGDHFELTNKGKRTFRSYPYLDQDRLNAGLRLLRDNYVPMRLATKNAERDRLHKEFQDGVTLLRFTYGKTATEVGRGMAPEDHSIKIGARTLELYKLRDLTSAFNWQHFFCVYFTWDEERKKLVINAFGHGDSPSSHT